MKVAKHFPDLDLMFLGLAAAAVIEGVLVPIPSEAEGVLEPEVTMPTKPPTPTKMQLVEGTSRLLAEAQTEVREV